MAGRNGVALVAALEAMAHAMENQLNTDGNVGSRSLATFQRENPPTFKGKYDPGGALDWLKEIERIFRDGLHSSTEGSVWYPYASSRG